MMIIASTATTSRYVITLLSVDAKFDVLRPLTAVWMLVKVLPIEVSVPLIDDIDDVMLVKLLSMLVIPAPILVTALLNDVKDDVILVSELSIVARVVARPLTCEVTPGIEPVTFTTEEAIRV